MLAIAVLTAGLLRAVRENRARARRAAATTAWPENAESARSTTRPSPCGPPAPAAVAAASASATSRGAPRAEFVEPFRSRVATITGAASGLLTVAGSAFQALHPGVAVAGALLGVAVRGFHGVVDIDIGDLVRPGQQRAAPGQLGQQLAGDRVELTDVAEGERAQERPERARRQAAGARTAPPARPPARAPRRTPSSGHRTPPTRRGKLASRGCPSELGGCGLSIVTTNRTEGHSCVTARAQHTLSRCIQAERATRRPPIGSGLSKVRNLCDRTTACAAPRYGLPCSESKRPSWSGWRSMRTRRCWSRMSVVVGLPDPRRPPRRHGRAHSASRLGSTAPLGEVPDANVADLFVMSL